jgi:hypothetical protein
LILELFDAFTMLQLQLDGFELDDPQFHLFLALHVRIRSLDVVPGYAKIFALSHRTRSPREKVQKDQQAKQQEKQSANAAKSDQAGCYYVILLHLSQGNRWDCEQRPGCEVAFHGE